MKKIILLLLLLAAIKAEAQKGIVFKMKYQPGHKYTSLMAIGINLKVNMTGNDTVLNKLKSQGITLPLALNANANINGDITTGAKSADNSFPLTVNFSVQDLALMLNGKQIDPLKGKKIGIKIYAHNNPDGKIVADSTFFNNKKTISNLSKNDSVKTSMSSMLDALQHQIKFPDRPLKVGDSFDQNAPMGNLPMGVGKGANITKSTVKTTYKLTGIAKGKAYFDIMQTVDVAVTVKTANVSLTGNGSGKLVYSIKDNFPLAFNNKLSMKLNVAAGSTVVDGSADITLDSTYTVN